MKTQEDGAISLLALLVVMALSIIIGSVSIIAYSAIHQARRAQDSAKERVACDAALREWLADYKKSNAVADSPLDETLQPSTIQGCSISIMDLSSALNLNYVDNSFFAEGRFASFRTNRLNPESFEAVRLATGLTANFQPSYQELFIPDAFQSFMTIYGFADVNTSDIDSISLIWQARIGSELPSSLREKLRDEKREAHRFSVDEVKPLLGEEYGELFPLISVAPPYNANYIDAHLLEALLAYPKFGIKDPHDRMRILMEYRTASKITTEKLRGLLGLPQENPIYSYLGVRTWFWGIKVKGQNGSILWAVVCRIPPEAGHELNYNETARFQLIERHFE